MKLIIDIDEWQYQEVCRNKGSYDFAYQVANGTPLPKHYGKIIDADELKATMHMNGYKGFATKHDIDVCFDYINNAPTIIEKE